MNQDPYSKCGSESTNLLKTEPTWIQIRRTAVTTHLVALLPVDHPDVRLQELWHDVVPAPPALPVALHSPLAIRGARHRVIHHLHQNVGTHGKKTRVAKGSRKTRAGCGNSRHIFVESFDNKSLKEKSRHHVTRRFFAFCHRQNVPRHAVLGQKCPKGQNVPKDKTSYTNYPVFKN